MEYHPILFQLLWFNNGSIIHNMVVFYDKILPAAKHLL